MAVGYLNILDENGVPQLSSAKYASDHSEPIPGDPPPGHLDQQDPSDLEDLHKAIVKLRIGRMVRMIISYLVTHALLRDGSLNPEHALCEDCELLTLLYRYHM